MISQDNLILVLGLLEKTESGEAVWNESNELLATLFKGFVRLDLPRSAVTIGMHQNDVIQFRVHNSDGTAIIDESARPSDRGYAELRRILDLSIRRSRKVDETLSDIQRFLAGGKRGRE